jgi:hypothetical protein
MQVWYLPFTVVALTICLFVVVSLQLNDYASNAISRDPISLRSILSSETINALDRDPGLNGALFLLTEVLAQTSTDLGDRFHSQQPQRARREHHG